MGWPATMDRKGKSFTYCTHIRRDMMCPSLDVFKVSNILNAVGKEEYGDVPDGEEPCRVCEEEIQMV